MEVPQSPEVQRPQLTKAQEDKLGDLCYRYKVEYRPEDYYVYPPDSWMLPGWCEGWVGGAAVQKEHPTIFVGVSPEGEAHS